VFSLIYIEKEIVDLPKVEKLCRRFSSLSRVIIDRYTEVFNRQRQNFRLQKQLPALIIAKKYQRFVLDTPKGYGIGSLHNYYFSHLMNCPFDCRYCFLQGMYSSAHFVFFVNQEDFQEEVRQKDSPEATFFTGYDCDSLAFESITGFVSEWIPFISNLKALVEFRTKSVHVRPFLDNPPLTNCVVAYTLNPHVLSAMYENKAPSLTKRLQAIEMLQERGWKVGLRFDPVIPHLHAKEIYQTFFREIFNKLSLNTLHSVSLGAFRMPGQLFKKMVDLYPKEPLFSAEWHSQKRLLLFCEQEILKYLPKEKFFPCYDWTLLP